MSDQPSPSVPQPPTLADVRRAAANIAGMLPLPTPLVESPGLSERLDAHVSLKLETASPINVFKLRGGLHFMAELPEAQRKRGVITASTGNHGQSIAYAAARFDVPAQICMPSDANPDKVASIKRLGGEVILSGDHFDDARIEAERRAKENDIRYVHPANEPHLIAGVATSALEVLETQQPDTDVVFVPVGGGSAACGWAIVRDGLKHPATVIGVQSAQSPAAHDSWRAGELLERPNTTIAEGLATGAAFDLPQRILRGRLNDFVLVDDAAILDALRALIDLAHVLSEPSGATSTAAAFAQADQWRGKRIVIVVTGANVTRDQLRAWL